jgi:ABC-type transport system involved in multi-copper enzyme maturation permease subunit
MATTESSTKLSTIWRELVTENPMVIEVNRFRRRFLEGGRGKSVNTTILVLAIVAYAALLLVIANLSGDFPPVALIFLQTGIFCFLGPALTFGSVAGEREKRSWDLLLVAPISHAQIIVGKFLAAAVGIGGALVLFLLPTMFTALTYKGDWNSYNNRTEGAISGTYALIGQEVVSVCFALMIAAMALLFSARCRRSLMALGIVLGALFICLIALPMLLGIMTGGAGMDLVNISHPFMAISRLEELRHYSSTSRYGMGDIPLFGPLWYGFVQGFFYLAATGLFLSWATKTVTFADGDKRFIPRKINA